METNSSRNDTAVVAADEFYLSCLPVIIEFELSQWSEEAKSVKCFLSEVD